MQKDIISGKCYTATTTDTSVRLILFSQEGDNYNFHDLDSGHNITIPGSALCDYKFTENADDSFICQRMVDGKKCQTANKYSVNNGRCNVCKKEFDEPNYPGK